MDVNSMGIGELRLAVQELRRYVTIPPAEFQRMRVEIERLQPLLPLAKEVREALAAACRVVATHGRVLEFLQESSAAGVGAGLGTRLQDAISAAEAAMEKTQ